MEPFLWIFALTLAWKDVWWTESVYLPRLRQVRESRWLKAASRQLMLRFVLRRALLLQRALQRTSVWNIVLGESMLREDAPGPRRLALQS